MTDARLRALVCLAAFILLGWATGAGPAEGEAALRLGFGAPGSDGLPEGWTPLTFRKIERHTRYTVLRDGDAYVVKAESSAAASGLVRKSSVDLARFPILRWRWKIDNLIAKGDVTRKEGDDYPARIYVTFAYDPSRASVGQRIRYEAARLIYGEYPPHAGINYIWDSKAPAGSIVANPFTDRVQMFVVDSGPSGVGEWVSHERNVYDDYRRAFKEDPPLVSGVAIMTDTDNTGESAVAYYGEIALYPAASVR